MVLFIIGQVCWCGDVVVLLGGGSDYCGQLVLVEQVEVEVVCGDWVYVYCCIVDQCVVWVYEGLCVDFYQWIGDWLCVWLYVVELVFEEVIDGMFEGVVVLCYQCCDLLWWQGDYC